MPMNLVRELPRPSEIKEKYPVSPELADIKPNSD